MKNIISRALILLATVFTFGHANAIEPPATPVPASINSSKMERALEHALNRNLSFPLLAKENMIGAVNVSFVIDKEGKVQVQECSSQNDALKAYVLRKLARIDIGDNPDGIWRTTHMRFVFRPEKA